MRPHPGYSPHCWRPGWAAKFDPRPERSRQAAGLPRLSQWLGQERTRYSPGAAARTGLHPAGAGDFARPHVGHQAGGRAPCGPSAAREPCLPRSGAEQAAHPMREPARQCSEAAWRPARSPGWPPVQACTHFNRRAPRRPLHVCSLSVSSNDCRPGTTVEVDGSPYKVTGSTCRRVPPVALLLLPPSQADETAAAQNSCTSSLARARPLCAPSSR